MGQQNVGTAGTQGVPNGVFSTVRMGLYAWGERVLHDL